MKPKCLYIENQSEECGHLQCVQMFLAEAIIGLTKEVSRTSNRTVEEIKKAFRQVIGEDERAHLLCEMSHLGVDDVQRRVDDYVEDSWRRIVSIIDGEAR